MFQIQSFTCEGLRDHLVTDCAAPTFAYFVSSDRAGASVQSAELTVNGWTIRNPDQCGTRYAGQPLKPFTTYTATLTVTSDSGETDTARLTFETGRMDMLQKDGMIDRLEERLKRTEKEVDARDETEIS